MRLGWLTDVHLNFVARARRVEFYAQLRGQNLDAVLLGGDTGEAEALRVPIYFVLVNHDFYRGSIATVRERVTREAAASDWLHWLPSTGVVSLTPDSALIGHDSWADGPGKHARYAKLNTLGDEAAEYLQDRALEALARHRNVIVLTHVPPFRESSWHEGRISNDDFLPHFACQAVGERLLSIMRGRPDRTMQVLCGHTHSPGIARPLDNLAVHTGGAQYGEPALQQILEIE
ncbi:MAG: metallophosphoesterase [Bryobacteraceae bacterium]